jgi:thioredoxin 1
MKNIVLLILFVVTVSISGLAQTNSNNTKYKVTFVELGSVKCIPCQKMQPVMKSIEKKYNKQVKVVFYDVWTEEGKPWAKTYNIKAIPTQVFIDSKGKEFFRHEGFFSEEEIIKVLKTKGAK